jgi:hypothetical protein
MSEHLEILARLNTIEALQHKILNSMPSKDATDLLSRKMIVDQYHVSLGTIQNAMKAGDLKFAKAGGRLRFTRQWVDEWNKLR